ncbi:MAG TPA: DUF5916 domain-containing protein [Vicinamibacterales bacterium]|nr:DUF5916 domain-containing protein [Vicinamibacterales bacterium]
MLTLLTVLALVALSEAQPSTSPPAAAVSPTMTATRVEQSPALDGEVLGDPAWASAMPATGFRQESPAEGAPASEATEVRVVFTHDVLYIGVVCFDRNPGGIIVSDSRRDTPLDETDSFQVIFDTYRDRLNGFVFGTNPAGIEYDGQVTNEGQGGGGYGPGQAQQIGSGGGFNVNWDGAWEVRARINSVGWSAEFAIPFRTLRFPPGSDQAWGVNFQRNIRRRNERAYWAPIPRQYSLYRLSLAGSLVGLRTPAFRYFQVTPFVLGNVLQSGERPVDPVLLGDAGFDAKYGPTPSLTLDATVNTDFAQVEVDEQQVNLDRFNLFFPEKRPFFLENAGVFSVGNPGEVDLFFSRRIGIDEDGHVVPILGGGRLSGKAGPYNIGLLNMQTAAHAALASTNYGVVRVSRELPNRSSLGALFVNRQSWGELSRGREHNRTYSIDGKWGIRQHTVLSGFAAGTSGPGERGDDYAFNVRSRTNVPRFDLELGYQEVGERFDPEVGFLTRRGYRKPDFRVMTRFRPRDFLSLHEIRPHTRFSAFVGFDGLLETMFWHIDSHWQFRNSYEVHTGMNLTHEGVRVPFEIYPGVVVPAGEYPHQEAQLVFMTDQGAPVSIETQAVIGGFFGGDRVRLTPTLRMRAGDALTSELAYERNDVQLPGGSFTTNLLRARVSYSFTTRAFLQALVQYNDRADIWSANLRFGLLQAANTGLFVVYTDAHELDELFLGPKRTNRSLTVKISRLFDVLR